MKRIAFMNQKGGVGKTTLTRNVGECLARQGKKVLLVDLDHQANLTLSLNVQYILDEEAGERTDKTIPIEFCLGDMFEERYFKAVELSDNLHLLPNEIGFASCEMRMQQQFKREYILSDVLKKSKQEYDYILFDCPPSFGLVTLNALLVADMLIVPVHPSEFSFRGLKTILKNIAMVLPEKDKSFFYAVTNAYRAGTVEGREGIARVSAIEGVTLFDTVINHAEAFSKAERQHVSIFETDNQRAKEQIESLTNEIKGL